MKLVPSPHTHTAACVGEPWRCSVSMYSAHNWGRGVLPSLPGHCRCHTEKENKKMRVSAKMEQVFVFDTENKGKPSKGKGNMVWAERRFFGPSAGKRVRSRTRSSCLLFPLCLCSVASPVGGLVYAHHPVSPPLLHGRGNTQREPSRPQG